MLAPTFSAKTVDKVVAKKKGRATVTCNNKRWQKNCRMYNYC